MIRLMLLNCVIKASAIPAPKFSSPFLGPSGLKGSTARVLITTPGSAGFAGRKIHKREITMVTPSNSRAPIRIGRTERRGAGERERGSEGVTERGSVGPTERLGDGASERGSDGETERGSVGASEKLSDGVSGRRNEIAWDALTLSAPPSVCLSVSPSLFAASSSQRSRTSATKR